VGELEYNNIWLCRKVFLLDIHIKIFRSAGHWWLSPVILTIQEAEIRRISSLRPAWVDSKNLSQKINE
jgi:hypothetical protein